MLIRETVISLIPRLARLKRDAFVATHLDNCLNYLVTSVNKGYG